MSERKKMTGRLAPPVGASATLADPITVGPDKSIRVDLSKLEAPHNVYDADFAWLEYGSDSVSLLFGKQDRNDSSLLRTRLEVRYSLEAFVRHFWRNSRTFHESLAKFVSDWRFVAKSGDPATMPAAKDHSEWANFEYIAHAGTEASIDFYRLPPSGLAQFAKGQGSSALRCVPVVRVHLTAFELLRLLDAIDPVVVEVEKNLPDAVRNELSKQEKD